MNKNKSIWEDTITLPSFNSLNNDIETDILVVGGGITGILTAYYLKQAGFNVVLVEKNKIGSGATKNTTAVVTSLQDTLYQDRVKKLGYKKARLYLTASMDAILEYKNLSNKYNFDYEEIPTYMYTCTNSEKLVHEQNVLKSLEFDTKITDKVKLPFDIQNAIMYPKQAQINALKLISELSKELTIYEHTEIKKITSKYAYTDKFKIKANRIILAIHFPFIDHLGMYYAKMYQTKSYVIAAKTKTKLDGAYISDVSGGLYFRKYHDYILIGGNDRKTGDKGVSFKNIRQFIKKNYPDANIEYEWVNQDCMTLDDIPYIGPYSNFSKNTFIATGFNLWGMTNAMIAAKNLTNLMLNKETEYTKLFNPNRVVINKQLFTNLGRYMKNLLTISNKRCTHLGSALKWNEEEGVWECPCHGSKYESDGTLISEPATTNMTNKSPSI